MHKRFLSILIVSVIIFFNVLSAFAQTSTVEEVQTVEGFVTHIYKCPQCPPNALCKPCVGDHIIISQDSGLKLRVFTKGMETFELGKKYTFAIRTIGVNLTPDSVNSFEILRYNKIEQ